MCRARWSWAALLGAGLVAELHGLRTPGHNGCTLSACTRSVFHTEHPLGVLTFTGGWLWLSWKFVPHICRRITETIQEA